MDLRIFMQNNSQLNSPDVAANIVASALARDQVSPEALGTLGSIWLTKGRPHLRTGFKALLAHPAALLVAVLQASLVYVITYDIYDMTRQHPSPILLGSLFSLVKSSGIHLPFIRFAFFASIPLFVLLNVGWGVMASVVCNKGQRFRLKSLLSGITGLIPLRFVSERFMPTWWFYRGEYRANMSISARVLQFSVAYSFATNRNKNEVEMAWAKVIDRHLKEVLDAFCSYALLPAYIVVGVMLSDMAVEYVFNVSMFYSLPDILPNIHFPKEFSVLASVAAWLAFERACLGAMVFQFLAEVE
jgi:hypothetical protein